MDANVSGIRRFGLQARLADGSQWRFDYRQQREGATGSVVVADGVETRALNGEPGLQAARNFVFDVDPSPRMSGDELLRQACAALRVGEDAIERLHVAVGFGDGTAIDVSMGS